MNAKKLTTFSHLSIGFLLKCISKKFITILLLLYSLGLYSQFTKVDPIALSDLNLSQKSPRTILEIFSLGIASHSDYSEHGTVIFSSDGMEIYSLANTNDQSNYKMYFMKMVDRIWSQPMISSSCLENEFYQRFTLFPDGKKNILR